MANFLTSIRIVCGLGILISPAFSKWYYILYLLGGITDAIDGTVARKLGKASSFGAKLDTAADIIFVVSVIIKLMASVYLPSWLLVWIGAIAVIKVINIITGFKKYHRFVTVHSVMNKVCGVIVFVVPLFIGGNYSCQAKAAGMVLACVAAGVAAVCEAADIIKGKLAE